MSNKNKKTKILLSSLLTTICLYAGQSFAEDMPIDFYPSVQPIISVAAGMGVSELGKSQNVTLIPASSPFGPFNYGYEANKKSQTTSFGQVFIGARWNTSPSFSVQAGLMGYYYRPFKLSGVIDLTGLNSGLRNYSYNYKIHSMGLMFATKLIWNASYRIHPFINGAVGVSINKSEDFTQALLAAPFAPVPPNSTSFYSDKSIASLAYMVGAGVNITLCPYLELGVGYEYANLGKAELGKGPGQVTNETPTIKNIVINQGYIELSYIGIGHLS